MSVHIIWLRCAREVSGAVEPVDSVGEYNWTGHGEIVRCQWHKWEFDIWTGESVYNPYQIGTRTYDTEVETRVFDPARLASVQTGGPSCRFEIVVEHRTTVVDV